MSPAFPVFLTDTARIAVRFRLNGRRVERYSVVLVAEIDGRERTIRLYDNTHGHNEMHRYTRSEDKQDAENLGDGDAGRAMREAIESIRDGWEGMITGWDR